MSKDPQPASVYMLFAADETCLYVGCSVNVSSRLATHANGRDWWTTVAYIQLEHFDSKRIALIRERQLIEHLQPTHNVRWTEPDTAPRVVALPPVPDDPDQEEAAA